MTDLEYNEQLASGICSSTDSILAGYKLLNALCVGVIQNIQVLKELLVNLFYKGDISPNDECLYKPLLDEPPLTEWEYYPHVGARPSKGYVGLKNAGATCYMNAVLQQVDISVLQ